MHLRQQKHYWSNLFLSKPSIWHPFAAIFRALRPGSKHSSVQSHSYDSSGIDAPLPPPPSAAPAKAGAHGSVGPGFRRESNRGAELNQLNGSEHSF
jgi:hypothetical protein